MNGEPIFGDAGSSSLQAIRDNDVVPSREVLPTPEEEMLSFLNDAVIGDESEADDSNVESEKRFISQSVQTKTLAEAYFSEESASASVEGVGVESSEQLYDSASERPNFVLSSAKFFTESLMGILHIDNSPVDLALSSSFGEIENWVKEYLRTRLHGVAYTAGQVPNLMIKILETFYESAMHLLNNIMEQAVVNMESREIPDVAFSELQVQDFDVAFESSMMPLFNGYSRGAWNGAESTLEYIDGDKCCRTCHRPLPMELPVSQTTMAFNTGLIRKLNARLDKLAAEEADAPARAHKEASTTTKRQLSDVEDSNHHDKPPPRAKAKATTSRSKSGRNRKQSMKAKASLEPLPLQKNIILKSAEKQPQKAPSVAVTVCTEDKQDPAPSSSNPGPSTSAGPPLLSISLPKLSSLDGPTLQKVSFDPRVGTGMFKFGAVSASRCQDELRKAEDILASLPATLAESSNRDSPPNTPRAVSPTVVEEESPKVLTWPPSVTPAIALAEFDVGSHTVSENAAPMKVVTSQKGSKRRRL